MHTHRKSSFRLFFLSVSLKPFAVTSCCNHLYELTQATSMTNMFLPCIKIQPVRKQYPVRGRADRTCSGSRSSQEVVRIPVQ
ncbi:uncharacterized protein B0T23DRAFT_373218 [Neurospora hispaniola]|uniref:Secreted protein n=1 Tax=Neurospora hispaniola TaxID=588809 RepID=A0AAJ0IC81_9PEZI|nr:hypothetical protein B0T23DRAFT_373218 [Neurospora hispaniola]